MQTPPGKTEPPRRTASMATYKPVLPPPPPHAVEALFQRQHFTVIAGPCVIESWELCRDLAQELQAICAQAHVNYIFKASFDKANRTAHSAFRGHGMHTGLEILARLRQDIGVATLTDIHSAEQAAPVAAAVDVLQIPAFLCRQSDLLYAAAATGRPTNIKKGQFLAPEDMAFVVQKFRQAAATTPVAVTERGCCFGYHNLVVDMRSLVIMRQVTQAPVIFDATHAVQQPSLAHGSSGGERHMAPVLARAAAAVGIDGLFCEVHFNPEQALSDAATTLNIPLFKSCLHSVAHIHHLQQTTAACV